MQTGRNRAAPLLWALALAAWCACALLAQRADGFCAGTAVYWSGTEGPSAAQLRRAEAQLAAGGRENLPRATLWRELGDQTVSQPGGGALRCDLLQCWGAAEDLLPLPLRAGFWPARGDTAGCAVDEGAAAALWGSADAVGRTLEWDGGRYTVRGVFRGDGGLVLVQGDPGLELPCGKLLLVFPEGGGREAAGAFLNAAGLAEGAVLDLPLLGQCLRGLSALPGGLLLVWIWALLLGRGRRLGGTPLLLACYLPAAVLCAGAALWAAGFPWTIPAQLLPSRWSDFSFWPRLLETHWARLTAFLAQSPGRRDVLLWPCALGVPLLAAAAGGLTALAARQTRGSTDGRCLAGCGAWLAGLSAAALWCACWDGGRLGGLALSRGMWLLPPLFLAVRRGLAVHAAALKPRGGHSHETQDRDSPGGASPQAPA